MTTAPLTLRQYQVEGAAFLASRKRALLGDVMGLGKSIEAIEALNQIAFNSEGSNLIICPASLRLSWKAELEKWYSVGPLGRRICHVIADEGDYSWPSPHIPNVVISFNQLAAFHLLLRQRRWEVIVVDEAQCMQTLDSQRTIQIRGGWGKAPIPCHRRWALTGTPMTNRPINLYPILKWLECDFAKKEFQFGERYCGGEKAGYRGATNLEELKANLKTVMLRRTKEEVLGELPPKTRQVIELSLDEHDRKKLLEDERQSLADVAIKPDFHEIVSKLEGPDGIDFTNKGLVARLRRINGEAKVDAAAEHIRLALESVPKVLVFAYHKQVIAAIHIELGGAAAGCWTITGDTDMTERHALVKRFQEDPKCRCLIANIEAAGVGLTLTAASLVIFVEQDWTPGKNAQAEARVDRIGQTENVLVQYLVVNGTLDATIARSNIRKQQTLDLVLT